jgi:uncharacterized protein with PIN domain
MMHDNIRRYYETHSRCPKCNERNFVATEINILDIPPENYIDRMNMTVCLTCGWRGYIDELKQ